MTLRWIPYSDIERTTYIEEGTARFAKELETARGLTAAEALVESRASHERLFPKGALAPEESLCHLEESGVRVGTILFGTRRDRSQPYLYLWDIHIKEEYRGKKVGERALLLLEAEARHRQLNTIRLNVFGHNVRAKAFYERLGYVAESTLLVKQVSQENRSALTLGADETAAFLNRLLPKRRLRVLEVGAGRGVLSQKLLSEGHDLVALEPDPIGAERMRAAGVACLTVRFLEYHSSELFDVVLFSRSLHHLSPLNQVLRHACELLVPGGFCVAEDFAIEAMEEKTAAWFYGTENFLEQLGLLKQQESLGELPPLKRWQNDHHHEELHLFSKMRAGFQDLFLNVLIEENPYLYRYWLSGLTSFEQAKAVLSWENDALRSRQIVPIGRRLVGQRA